MAAYAADAARRYFGDDRTLGKKPITEWDVAALLKVMWEAWNDVFGKTLGRAERSLVQELRELISQHHRHFAVGISLC